MNIDIEEVKINLVWFYANVDMSTENRARIECAEIALEQLQSENKLLKEISKLDKEIISKLKELL